MRAHLPSMDAYAPHWPLALLALALGAAGMAVLAQPWWARRRHRQLLGQPFPRAWARVLQRRVPAVQQLPAPLQRRLRGLVQLFIADKPFIGCAGLQVDDEMRVTIAAQACLMLLGQPGDDVCYPQLRRVLVYPQPFVVPRRQLLPGGVVSEQPQTLAGESWAQGQVILAWSEVLDGAADPHDGRNVVLHEFAHQIDQDGGQADGRPWQRDEASRQRWAQVMDEGLARLRAMPSDTLDAYGSTDAAEYFAVATEAFFERPRELQEAAPELYAELSRLYRLDPQAWTPAAGSVAAAA